MAHPTAVHAVAPAPLFEPEAEVRDLLYKADHPRPIDRHIDFFGDGFGDGVLTDGARDRCGELVLEWLASMRRSPMRGSTISTSARGLGVGLALALLLGGCAGVTTSNTGSASPSSRATTRPSSSPTASAKPIDGAQAERLKRVMVPLIQAMNRPLPLNQVKVGIMDDSHINAASAGHGEFYVTRGLLEKANDQHLAGVLAHELAHDDLNHVAKAQTLGTGLSIGAVILDQVIPGAGAIVPIAGQLVINKYTQREEYAADQHGAEMLQKAGMSREIMADTLTWLMHTDGGSSGGFFATHPATADRIEALRR